MAAQRSLQRFGLNYASGGVEFDKNLNTGLANAAGDRSKVTLDASGVDAFGANLGFMANINDKLSAKKPGHTAFVST